MRLNPLFPTYPDRWCAPRSVHCTRTCKAFADSMWVPRLTRHARGQTHGTHVADVRPSRDPCAEHTHTVCAGALGSRDADGRGVGDAHVRSAARCVCARGGAQVCPAEPLGFGLPFGSPRCWRSFPAL